MATEVQNYEGALDKGLEGVVACTTSVSSIIENTLNFRGYTIEDLSQNASFEEVVYLLWNDKLPNKSELAAFRADLDKEMKLDAAFIQVLKGIPTKVHPMAWLRSAVSLLAHWDVDANDNSHAANLRKSLKLTAKMSSIVCAYDAIRNGKDPVQPVAGKSIAWNFMYMLGGGKEPDAELVKIFDTCLG